MGYLNLTLRLVIWFLLTSDLSLANIIIGVGVALLLPGRGTSTAALKYWLRALGEIIKSVPKAYQEAFEIILNPHNYEDITMERVKPKRTPGLIFLDIFIITFTPKTLVLKYHQEGWFEVHWVRRHRKDS